MELHRNESKNILGQLEQLIQKSTTALKPAEQFDQDRKTTNVTYLATNNSCVTVDDTAELHPMKSFTLDQVDIKDIVTKNQLSEKRKDRILNLTRFDLSPFKKLNTRSGSSSNFGSTYSPSKLQNYLIKSHQNLQLLK